MRHNRGSGPGHGGHCLSVQALPQGTPCRCVVTSGCSCHAGGFGGQQGLVQGGSFLGCGYPEMAISRGHRDVAEQETGKDLQPWVPPP